MTPRHGRVSAARWPLRVLCGTCMSGMKSPFVPSSADHAYTVDAAAELGRRQSLGRTSRWRRLARSRCLSTKTSEESAAAQARERQRHRSTDLAGMRAKMSSMIPSGRSWRHGGAGDNLVFFAIIP